MPSVLALGLPGQIQVGGERWLTYFFASFPQDFQDEMATLNLQLNMAEEKSTRLQKENQDLVDRWMARMGQEAEAMNDASKFS